MAHGAGVYLFDPGGAAHAILTGLDQPNPDLNAAGAAIRLAAATKRPGLLGRLLGW